MLINLDEKYRDRLFVALMRAQGDVLVQLEKGRTEQLKEEYKDLEDIAKIIKRTFENS